MKQKIKQYMNSALLLCAISLLLPSCFKNSKIKERSETDAGETDSATDATTTGNVGTVTDTRTDTGSNSAVDGGTETETAIGTGSTTLSSEKNSDTTESSLSNTDSTSDRETSTDLNIELNTDTSSTPDNLSDTPTIPVTDTDTATSITDTLTSDISTTSTDTSDLRSLPPDETDTDCTAGCRIGGTCYEDGRTNPQNQCEKCDFALASNSWSNNDEAPCNDGIYCNGEDSCLGGECSQHKGNPCETTCLEEQDACCNPEVCATARSCDANGDVVCTNECGNPILVEDCRDVALDGSCRNGTCGCTAGWMGSHCSQCVMYVDGENGDNTNTGTSWNNAFKDVQDAINEANSNNCSVWVAAGEYRDALILYPGVSLYGGFQQGDFSIDQQDPTNNVTILSGDIQGDDGENFSNTDDNAYHVVSIPIAFQAEPYYGTIDGFTITGGNANGDDYDETIGGGLLISAAGAVTVANCRFVENQGGAIYSDNRGEGELTIIDSSFENNRGTTVNSVDVKLTVSGSTFTQNQGIGLNVSFTEFDSSMSYIEVSDCDFVDNDQGGIYSQFCNAAIINSSFKKNELSTGSALYSVYGSLIIRNSIFVDNSSESNAGAVFSADNNGDTLIEGCSFLNNTSNEGNGGAISQISNEHSLVISDCQFEGNISGLGGALFASNNGPTEVTNSQFFNNHSSSSGGGAYLYSGEELRITDCQFIDNTASVDGGGMISLSSADIVGVVFQGNESSSSGGGAYTSSESAFVNCTIADNNTGLYGGGIYTGNDSYFSNCVFLNNLVESEGNSSDLLTTGDSSISNSTLFNTISAIEAIWSNRESIFSIKNSIIWTTADAFSGFNPSVEYSNVKQESGVYPGTGNINADPLFRDPTTGDLRLSCPDIISNCSPCINAGQNSAVAQDRTDLDGDNITVESTPFDLDDNPRILDDFVDMGAYEF